MKRLLYVLAATLIWFSPLSALGASDPVREYIDASATFQQLLKDYAARGIAPSSERVSSLLAQLTDPEVLATARKADDPFRVLLEVCGAGNAANMSLSLFGLANSGAKTNDPAEAATIVRGLLERNTLRFQDQIFPLTGFLTSCFAIHLPYMSSFLQNLSPGQLTPNRVAGAKQFRSSTEQFLSQSLALVADSRFNEKLRFELLETLALRAPAYAETLPQDRRDGIKRVGELALKQAPIRFRLSLRRVVEAMNTDKCNALCSL